MKVTKKIIDNLTKCYAIGEIEYNKKQHFVVACEKYNECYLYDEDFNRLKTIWDGPGGTMSIVPLEGVNGGFLATNMFYSPNDSKNSKIVVAIPDENYNYEVNTLTTVPFAHRFDVIKGEDGTKYLIVCSLKSDHEFKDDWSHKGLVYARKLGDDLTKYNEYNQLPLTSYEILQTGMLKNHGYYRLEDNGIQKALISCNEGVFEYIPPKKEGEKWTITQLVDTPASDATYADLDNDGVNELIVFSPFHGNKLKVYKNVNSKYELVKEFEEDFDFLHAIWSCQILGKNTVIVGHRKGLRNLMLLQYNSEKNDYEYIVIDENIGPANAYHYIKDGKDRIIAANREIDEIALYEIE